MLPDMTDLGPIVQTAQAENAARSKFRVAEEAQPAAADIKASDKAGASKRSEDPKDKSSTNRNSDRRRPKDSLELSFHLTPEERDAMVRAFSIGEALDREERSTLRTTAERISKAIDETLALRSENRDRVEKAVAEWYSKIAQGENGQPFELIKLLRMASLGQFDFPLIPGAD
jgi:hypothetical protein